LIVGNIFGIGVAWLQSAFGFIKLDPQHYYVSEVPVMIDAGNIILLNVCTLAICLAMLLLPALAVNNVKPAKAIRFN